MIISRIYFFLSASILSSLCSPALDWSHLGWAKPVEALGALSHDLSLPTPLSRPPRLTMNAETRWLLFNSVGGQLRGSLHQHVSPSLSWYATVTISLRGVKSEIFLSPLFLFRPIHHFRIDVLQHQGQVRFIPLRRQINHVTDGDWTLDLIYLFIFFYCFLN